MSDRRPVLHQVGGATRVMLLVYDGQSKEWVPAERGVEIAEGSALALKVDREYPRVEMEVVWGRRESRGALADQCVAVENAVMALATAMVDRWAELKRDTSVGELALRFQNFAQHLRYYRKEGVFD